MRYNRRHQSEVLEDRHKVGLGVSYSDVRKVSQQVLLSEQVQFEAEVIVLLMFTFVLVEKTP